MADGGLIPHDLVKRRHTDLLRLHVGQGKRFSVEAVAEARDRNPRTLRSHLEGVTNPNLDCFLDYAAALGPSYLNGVLEMAGYGGAHRLDEAEVCPNKTMAGIARRMHQLAAALEDQRIDHREAAELKPELTKLSAELAAFAAGLGE